MHPAVAQAIAESVIRRQHIPMPWTKADEKDRKAWTKHDNEKHPHRYGLCPICQGV